MKPAVFLIAALMTAGSVAAAPIYQWKDAQGRMVYSDQQPPPSVRNAQQKSFKGSFIEGGESYELKQAREKFPVTLYAGSCGEPCDHARQLLQQRGIPFNEIDPSSSPESLEALKKLTGHNQVPVLVVGSDKINGFEEGQWQAALDRAHYPKSSTLPKKAEPPKNASSTPNPTPNAPKPSPAGKP